MTNEEKDLNKVAVEGNEEKKKPSKKRAKKPSTKAKVDELSEALNAEREACLDLTKERDQYQRDAEDAKDQALRSLAELENVKRRKEQEKVDAIKFANERLITDLLPILDAFDLAMGQANRTDASEVQAVVTGFEMIQTQLTQFLDKLGVVRIDALDQPFDPTLHQGISQESHPDKDENTVVKEMQPGYTLNERVIRPSMVVVSTK
ncbi:MAG: nucleotide exchange factor GrpE [Candidatus Marinamargulisbacteria bacterium]